MKKAMIYIFEIFSILCTCFITLMGIKIPIFNQIGLLKDSNNEFTLKGNIIIVIVCILSAILGVTALVCEGKNLCSEKRKKKCKNIFSRDEMRSQYLKSLVEASMVTILVKDLEDLCDDEEQKKEIMNLGENCTILYQKCKNDELKCELVKEDVKLYRFPTNNNVSKIKGQIVDGPQEHCILIEKKSKTDFQLLNINNAFIQRAIKESVNKIIEDSKNTSHSINGGGE